MEGFLVSKIVVNNLYGARGQGWSLPLVFFLASKAPPWTRRPRLRLGLKTFKLFLDEIQIDPEKSQIFLDE